MGWQYGRHWHCREDSCELLDGLPGSGLYCDARPQNLGTAGIDHCFRRKHPDKHFKRSYLVAEFVHTYCDTVECIFGLDVISVRHEHQKWMVQPGGCR